MRVSYTTYTLLFAIWIMPRIDIMGVLCFVRKNTDSARIKATYFFFLFCLFFFIFYIGPARKIHQNANDRAPPFPSDAFTTIRALEIFTIVCVS